MSLKRPSKEVFTLLNGKTLITAIAVWPLILLPICFILYYTVSSEQAKEDGSMSEAPTYSRTGAVHPGDLIFTYFVHSESAMIAVFFITFYSLQKKKINAFPISESMQDLEAKLTIQQQIHSVCCGCFYDAPVRTTMQEWNKILCYMGSACALFLSLVGTITLAVNYAAHTLFALLAFGGGLSHLILYYYKIAWYMETRNDKLIYYKVCLFICVPFSALIVIIAGSLYLSCSSNVCQSFAESTFAVLEFILSITLIVYICSFYDDIDDIVLTPENGQDVSLHKQIDNLEHLKHTNGAGANCDSYKPPIFSGVSLSRKLEQRAIDSSLNLGVSARVVGGDNSPLREGLIEMHETADNTGSKSGSSSRQCEATNTDSVV